MKHLFESILDDEDVLINNASDLGLGGFESSITSIVDDISSRLKKASNDKLLKDYKFPTEDEIYNVISDLFKIALKNNKTITSNFSSYYFEFKIKYTGKKSIEDLNDFMTNKRSWEIDDQPEVIALNSYFDTVDSWEPVTIKVKSKTGNIIYKVVTENKWLKKGKDIYLELSGSLSYKPNAAALKSLTNKKALDTFGHEISDGDWCAGTQISCPQIVYGTAILTKTKDKVYIYDGKHKNMCLLSNCIVIKHNGKPVDMSDVKDDPIQLHY
jgi:hypothetical protein